MNTPQALNFIDGDDTPTLLLRDVDLPLALETSWVNDVRTYDLVADSFASRADEILSEKGVTTGRVAIELSSYAVPTVPGDALRAELKYMKLLDATHIFGDLRHIKSPGVSEMTLAASIEAAMRHADSDYWAIPTEPASGNRTAGGHATPRQKLVEPGDLIHVEFAGVSHRNHATAIQTVACGEPSAEARELYDIALAPLSNFRLLEIIGPFKYYTIKKMEPVCNE